ncbi:MAG: cytosine permease [Pseudomonadota bacterium]
MTSTVQPAARSTKHQPVDAAAASGTDLVEDFATRPVPDDQTYSGWRIGFVLGGIGIALPALLSGAEVGQALGYERSLQAFALAALLVTALSSLSGWVGMRSRLSTYMILKFAFGSGGATFVNLAFAVAQFGWFGVNAYFFGTAAESVGREVLGLAVPSAVYIVSGGVLMIAATVFGFKALDKLALLAFPLLLAVLAVMLARTFDTMPASELAALTGNETLTLAQAVTVLAGGIIVGVLLVPDLTRYARGPFDVVIAVVIALTLVETLVHVVAAGPALAFSELEPLALMRALGFGVVAFAFLIFASLSTNVVNLYGSSLALAAIQPRVPSWIYVVVSGAIGTLLGLLDVASWFIDFLVWQSVLFSAVLGVYVVDFFVVRRGAYDLASLEGRASFNARAMIAWACGAAIAAVAYLGWFSITGAANLDAVLVGAGVYAALESLRRRG